VSVISVIDAFPTSDGDGAGVYTVTRRGAETVTSGLVTYAASTTFTIAASVQPPDGRVLRALPEGRHESDVRIVLTSTALRIADSVEIGDEAFEVFAVEGPYELDGDTHVEAQVARQVIP